MDYKAIMIKQAKTQGRESLYPFTIGVITSIITHENYSPNNKIRDITLAIEGMDEASKDKSLPWDYSDVKKASASTETAGK